MMVKAQTKPIDTAAKYHLTEAQVLQISKLLEYADGVAGNSDKISTREYNLFHKLAFQVDSIFKIQYLQFHPVKKDAKKP